MGRIDGKIALITGAASGIGFACAERFAREGAGVAGLDLTLRPHAWDRVEAAAPHASFAGGIDVRDEPGLAEAVRSIASEMGRIDILVNAAGVGGGGIAHELERGEWDRVLDVNLTGSFLVAKHVLRVMVRNGSGSVIHLASVEGLEGTAGTMVYNVSKGGVVQMTRTMALDYARQGIRVNCLCPGLIDTPLTAILKEPGLEEARSRMIALHAMERAGTPEEVAACALFLASDEASFVTGSALVVDGGWTAGRRIGL